MQLANFVWIFYCTYYYTTGKLNRLDSALVCYSCCNKVIQSGLKLLKFIFSQYGGWKSKIEV